MSDTTYAGLVTEVNLLNLGVTPNERVHWSVRSARNRSVRAIVRLNAEAVLRAIGKPWWGIGKPCCVRTEVVLGKGRRTRDVDNLMCALKPCFDGLVDAGLLVDDNPRWVEFVPPSQRRGTDPLFTRVILTVTPLSGA